MKNHITRRGNATLVAGRVGVQDPSFILIDDKTSHLLDKLGVDWYTLVKENTFGRYFLTREPLEGDKALPLRTFNILMDTYHETDYVTVNLPSNIVEDYRRWPGFIETLSMIKRSNSKCSFKFNTEQTLTALPEYQTAFVFQKKRLPFIRRWFSATRRTDTYAYRQHGVLQPYESIRLNRTSEGQTMNRDPINIAE